MSLSFLIFVKAAARDSTFSGTALGLCLPSEAVFSFNACLSSPHVRRTIYDVNRTIFAIDTAEGMLTTDVTSFLKGKSGPKCPERLTALDEKWDPAVNRSSRKQYSNTSF